MTDTELTELESLAKAATPGPWDTKEGPDFSEIFANSKNIALVGSQHKDAAYIAAVSPDTLLELITEVKRLRKTIDLLERGMEGIVDKDKIMRRGMLSRGWRKEATKND